MNIVSLEEVSRTFGITPVLDRASLGIQEGEKIGLIGANGSGKTTLLRIIAGQEVADQGRVVTSNGKRITYLSQNPEFDADQSVLAAVVEADRETLDLLGSYEEACASLSTQGGTDERLMSRVADLAHRLELAGAWELEVRAKNILQRLQLPDMTARIGNLSGGQRKRVALAHALAVTSDLLILDEPTNHLDAETVEWLESYLADFNGALLVVTHDRYFLDRVADTIIEIDRGRVIRYDGNYAWYLEKKELQEASKQVEGQRRDAMIRRELAWLRRGAKARTTKQKARVDRAEALMAAPKEQARAGMEMPVRSQRLGRKILELHGISKSFGGQTVVKDFSYIVKRGERMGVIGPNGSGKTTLLEIIAGRLKPDAGELLTGETVVLGYYDQESRLLNDEQRVIDYIKEASERVETADGESITASQMLTRFLFPPEMQFTLIARLSGGERRRLYLLRVLMTAPNVLLMDEVTNDLDLDTLIVLEDYLDSFPGCLIVVSHDRYFLDRVVDKVFRFEGQGTVREYPGNYSAFLEIRDREAAEKSAIVSELRSAQALSPRQTAVKQKLSYNEGRELEALEERIAKNEERKREVERLMEANASDFVMIQTLDEELRRLTSDLERDMERWAVLAEFA